MAIINNKGLPFKFCGGSKFWCSNLTVEICKALILYKSSAQVTNKISRIWQNKNK
jgi:hypothetical protein